MYRISQQRCTENIVRHGYGNLSRAGFLAVFVALLVFTLFGHKIALGANSNRISSWACYYGSEDRTAELSGFDLVVSAVGGQDPSALREKGIKVLAYVSLGEVAGNGPYYDEALRRGLLVRYNTNWDSWVVDVRSRAWREMLFERIIPDALAAGYDGLFFDTLDSPIDMQRRDPDKYKGMERQCVELVKAIRDRYPKLLLCQNRGFEIVRRTAPYIDYLLIEGLSSSMDLSTGVRSDVAESDRKYLLERVGAANSENPALVVLSLDYAPADDLPAIKHAFCFSRKQGFVPYVSTPDLHEVFAYEGDY